MVASLVGLGTGNYYYYTVTKLLIQKLDCLRRVCHPSSNSLGRLLENEIQENRRRFKRNKPLAMRVKENWILVDKF